MGIYSLWGHNGYPDTLVAGDKQPETGETDLELIKIFNAVSWEDACSQYHEFMGWEPYKPVEVNKQESPPCWDKWTTIFPGKMGLAWKHAYPYEVFDTQEEAEAQAKKNCNVVAIPLQLLEHITEMQRRVS